MPLPTITIVAAVVLTTAAIVTAGIVLYEQQNMYMYQSTKSDKHIRQDKVSYIVSNLDSLQRLGFTKEQAERALVLSVR